MKSRQIIPLRSVVAVFMAAVMLFATVGSLFVPQLDSYCGDHCDDSCEDCSDCILCQGTLHMLVAGQFAVRAADPLPSWLCSTTSNHRERIFAVNIDHPPQNIA